MRIVSDHSANNIFQIYSSRTSKRKATKSAETGFDTVNISDKARAAYMQLQPNALKTSSLSAQQEKKLTLWFNGNHDGANFPITKNINIDHGSGTILPENKNLKDNIEKEIDRIIDEDEATNFELLEKLAPLHQKLNVISALGNSVVLDEKMMTESSSFLQVLEDAWKEMVSEDTSVAGQFYSATRSWKEHPQTEEEIREKIEKAKSDVVDSLVSSESLADVSDASLEAYGKTQINASEIADKSDSDTEKEFKKYFNSYRGNGIFAEEDSDANQDSVTGTGEDSDSEKINKKASELERKIKDLISKLETVMSSNMPETEKDAMGNQIQKEISELQSQLTAYKQAEKAMQGGEAA